MSLRKQAISGIKWTFLQQLSIQLISFLVQIVLARLLMPEEFGLIAMIVVFISMGQTLTDSGMTSSLIRSEAPKQVDYSTVFITNLLASCFIYCCIYFSAPYIATFYNQSVLVEILRVFALTFVFRALYAVHIAKLTKEMNFKLQMKLQIPSTIIAGCIAMYLAQIGFGVWSLVWLNLIQVITSATLYWFFVDWKPSLVYDIKRFKFHFIFGYKLTLSSLLDTAYTNSYRIIIGKSFSPAIAGYYNLAETMRLFPVQQISAVIGKVTYPLFANISDDERLKKIYCISMKLVLVIVIPVMLSLILVAEEGFRFVFGDHWLFAVPFFQILALASIVRPISSYNLNILKVKGRSDLFLRLEIIKKILGVFAIIIGLSFGIIGLVISATVHFYITVIIDMHFSGRLISYYFKEQLGDIYHLFLIAAMIFLILYYVKTYSGSFLHNDAVVIFTFILAFNLLYLTAALIIDRSLWAVIKSIVKNKQSLITP
ncbi:MULTISPECIES: lipopolysaccharide biosynthesis protein [unclassified Pseudoalteromonas]|uniref:lipopolysaccharide biosynthesis protein n=1 Tax=unclassified Pseudoalteromonas TaxID=194690 RepID=UPI002358DF7B|nr:MULTISPECIES: lipopolysaccharide biosynthesis protein [unclassified Pseudoalteromonas]MDC9499810.1 lipopolysaccharide biosynthesis protein [Pseudoalteromonas sp. Angola-20]MDC9518591.1 lipopolysaccharide biosynthesis protein [Pseudoalteromonas sp. Angola-22]MDC9534998.1 lipopolysaccharide biosynthesis protein [Pseudoalteromonas sp. Angola-9]